LWVGGVWVNFDHPPFGRKLLLEIEMGKQNTKLGLAMFLHK